MNIRTKKGRIGGLPFRFTWRVAILPHSPESSVATVFRRKAGGLQIGIHNNIITGSVFQSSMNFGFFIRISGARYVNELGNLLLLVCEERVKCYL